MENVIHLIFSCYKLC